jgi:hypothetical protein
MKFANADEDWIDYNNFFHIFLQSYVTSLREVLQEWVTLAMDEGDRSTKLQLSSPFAAMASFCSTSSVTAVANISTQFYLLPGEMIILEPKERLYWSISTSKNVKEPVFFHGLLYLTNFRIIVTSQRLVFVVTCMSINHISC